MSTNSEAGVRMRYVEPITKAKDTSPADFGNYVLRPFYGVVLKCSLPVKKLSETNPTD